MEVFIFLHIKVSFVLSLPFTRGIKPNPLLGFHSLPLRKLGRPWDFSILVLLLLLHVNLHFKFGVSDSTLPNSSTIPNTLKKFPRNPCLDQQKQFGVISRFHHFLLESLKH